MGLTIGKLATAVGVTVETIRYYERVGLLAPRGRTGGGYRQYGSEAVARLRFVRRATALGFSLVETKELLALRARPGARCGVVRLRAEAKLAALEDRIRELTELRDAVARLVGACRGETAVAHCNILLELDKPAVTSTQEDREEAREEGELSCRPTRSRPPRSVPRASKHASAASRSA